MLEEKTHLPAVLQSLGCIAETATAVFETRESEIVEFIKSKILGCGNVCFPRSTWTCVSSLYNLIIYNYFM